MKKLVINASIIIVSSLLFNTAGIFFRVFLSNKIGTEGIGLYQLILSVYLMAILFVVNGINVAVTRLIAEEGGRASFSISRALIIRALSVSFLYSVPAFLFLYFGAEYIGLVWLDDVRAVFPLKLMAVGLPFAGVSACIKGYFYAVSKIIRPTAAQAAELTIQIFVIVKIIDYFMLGGPEYACAAIAVGMTIAEITSCLCILTFYRIERWLSGGGISKIYQKASILKKLFYISLPVSASSLIRSSLRALENIMIPIGFERYGYTNRSALEQYGKIQGMVMPVLMFPASVIIAFSSLLIPEVSEANALNQKKRVDYSVTRALQLTSIMSILISGVFAFFSDHLGPAIYEGTDCGYFMKVMAPLIPLIYLDIVVQELLKALNQQVSALMYSVTDAVARIVLIYYLLPEEGIFGLIFVLYFSNLFSLSLGTRRLLKITRLRLNVRDWAFKPVLSAAASGFIAVYLLDLTGMNPLPDVLYILAGVASMCFFYFFFLVWFGCLTRDDFKWFKILFNCPSPETPDK
ncbi:MAG TPA: polysaccharide biosynthesis C-terminal domain-containing protein [Anaerovoracaceae bacterium]|nr:polysaccharide biosynthesis C-terminal domain-containing protein [Anaerovoracaceae bacterium]